MPKRFRGVQPASPEVQFADEASEESPLSAILDKSLWLIVIPMVFPIAMMLWQMYMPKALGGVDPQDLDIEGQVVSEPNPTIKRRALPGSRPGNEIIEKPAAL